MEYNPYVLDPTGNYIGEVRLVSLTPNALANIVYMARVSNPKNQSNPSSKELIKYLLKHKHYSPFEMANMTLEIVCPLAISVQILRHRSFSFQQLSGRYTLQNAISDTVEDSASEPVMFNETGIEARPLFYIPNIRKQDTKNRQNSIHTDATDLTNIAWRDELKDLFSRVYSIYDGMIRSGVAREVARLILPEGVITKLYMNGTIRSWIHYLEARDQPGIAQYEHVLIAQKIKELFTNKLKDVSDALEFNTGTET